MQIENFLIIKKIKKIGITIVFLLYSISEYAYSTAFIVRRVTVTAYIIAHCDNAEFIIKFTIYRNIISCIYYDVYTKYNT